jgi:hypothetical protein
MIDFDIAKMSKKQLRNFGFVTSLMIALVFGLFLPWIFDRNYPIWPWWLSGGGVLWALVLPATLQGVYQVWMKIAYVLGQVNTHIILGLCFYIIVLPIGLIMRVVGKNPMNRKLSRDIGSYRVISHKRDNDHVERPF